jgi:PPOX class probable F420-dependent enzyme
MTEYMGHGVKQRAQIAMTREEIDAFLHGRHTMTMCTINPDGNIHAVGMWYGFLEGAIAVESKAKSQKVQNVRRDPRITCMIETGEYYEELQGVSVIGRAEVVDDPARMWELGVSVMERYYMPYTDELRPAVEAMLNKRVVIKVDPIKVISWDHRKLGLPSTRPARTGGIA